MSDDSLQLAGAAEDVHHELLGAPEGDHAVHDLAYVEPAPEPEGPEGPGPAPAVEPAEAPAAVEARPAPDEAAPAPKAEDPPSRRIRAFPALPPDATLPPPAATEELPPGAPRGLADAPPVAAPALPSDLRDPSLPTFRQVGTYSIWEASEAGEDFPTPRQVLQAVLWSAATALIGFGFSYVLFVKHQAASNVPRIDRRAAESVPPLAYREQQGQVAISFAGYVGGGLSEAPKPKPLELALKAPKLETPTPTPTPTSTPTPTPTPTPTANSDNEAEYPQEQGAHHVGGILPKRPDAPSTRNPDSPAVPSASRPAVKGWVAAWREAREASVAFYSIGGPAAGGVIVSKEGLVLTCNSRLSPETMSRAMTSHGVVSAQLVASDPEADVALLQLAPGDYAFLPLCPEMPRAGDWFITPFGEDPTRSCQQQCCGSLSAGTFRVRGAVLANAIGYPMINDRAEVVGISLGHPWLFTGNQQVVAAATRLGGLLQGGKSREGGHARPANNVLVDFLGSLPTLAARERPSTSNAKVVPGESLGNYPLGLSRAQLTAECGQPSRVEEQEGLTRAEFPTQHITCTLAQDKVVAIESDYSFYMAGRGLAAGSPVDGARFQSEFAGAIWVEHGGLALGLAPGLELECRGGKILKVRVVPK